MSRSARLDGTTSRSARLEATSTEAEGGPGGGATDDPGAGMPRWPARVSMVLCGLGAAVAGYLTYAHFTTAAVLACPERGIINCAKVTTSPYSSIAGVPVAVAGLAFFVVMGALSTPRAWRSPARSLRGIRLLLSTAGVGMVLWLLYVELFRLNAICLYCSAVHAITVALFVTVMLGTTAADTVEQG